eukprot:XP_028350094.1 zinc finger protein 618 [Physeter catodon]
MLLRSYECGICGKKYKYYNCFQTHVRAHRDTEATSGEGASQGNNFRYTCDICGKKYKYYSCFQEHRDLHAVDVFSVEGAPENRADPFDQGVVATDEVKEEPPEPFQKIGPMNNITSEIFKKKEVRQCQKRETGNYTCEFCGKQYKYYTPYQEHVALHAPIIYVRPKRALLTYSKALGPRQAPSLVGDRLPAASRAQVTPHGCPPRLPAGRDRLLRLPAPGLALLTLRRVTYSSASALLLLFPELDPPG